MIINTLNNYIKKRFGRKLYKISLDAGMTCPNRDGTLDTRGCIFCSAGGSGDFASSRKLSISEQIDTGKALISKKFKQDTNEPCYIAQKANSCLCGSKWKFGFDKTTYSLCDCTLEERTAPDHEYGLLPWCPTGD